VDQHPLTLRINGEERAVPGPMTVAQLLAHLGIEARQVAVERNRAIVRRGEHATTVLADGDQLEIVTFVGGG
jgi:thiamine biosynthesis protein ThiS